ncbi:MAG: hypothetical protein U0L22_02595 [Bacteroidales bacterium]|jgi:FtsH-binding integral membrane protein|nr:hypothetical protein [Bacteroidales bacterium]
MKKDYRKIYWTVALIWGVIASICAVAYALLFDKDAPIDGQSSAMAVWNVAYWSVITLLGASLLVAIGFALAQVIKGLIEDPKKQMGIIIAVVALIVVFVASYLLSSGTDVPQEVFEKTGSDYSSSKLIGACMYTVYILFGGVLVSVLFAEISKKIK